MQEVNEAANESETDSFLSLYTHMEMTAKQYFIKLTKTQEGSSVFFFAYSFGPFVNE